MVLRQIIVEYGINTLDINASCSNVRCNQDVASAVFEAVHDLCPLHLLHITMQSNGCKATILQGFGQFIHHFLGVAEYHRGNRLFRCEQQVQSISLSAHWNIDGILCNSINGTVWALNLYHLRVFLILLGDGKNRRRHGCREQNRLAVFRCLSQNGFDIFPKSHVQHFVCFI